MEWDMSTKHHQINEPAVKWEHRAQTRVSPLRVWGAESSLVVFCRLSPSNLLCLWHNCGHNSTVLFLVIATAAAAARTRKQNVSPPNQWLSREQTFRVKDIPPASAFCWFYMLTRFVTTNICNCAQDVASQSYTTFSSIMDFVWFVHPNLWRWKWKWAT